MSSATPPVPVLRILDAAEALERAHGCQTWSELWQALAREAEADDPRERPVQDRSTPGP